MGTTLSYGFEKPATGDKGSTFFPALESDIQQMNDHNHNGVNSAKLAAGSTQATVQHLAHASWVGASAPYSMVVTIPSALTLTGSVYEDLAMQFRNHADGSIMYLDMVKDSSTTFTLYINDNTIDVDVAYT